MGTCSSSFKFFGSGAETFAPLYYFYRDLNPGWAAYAHNDYLETLITFGWFGAGTIFLIFVSICLVPFHGDGFLVPKDFVFSIGLGMAGIMVHALVDLPFQIYSLHIYFVVFCSLLTCLKM